MEDDLKMIWTLHDLSFGPFSLVFGVLMSSGFGGPYCIAQRALIIILPNYIDY